MLYRISAFGLLCLLYLATDTFGQGGKFPPTLPNNQAHVTDRSDDFLKPPATLRKDVAIATTPPTVDFFYLPGQTYAGKPWYHWGEGLAANGKYYTTMGDQLTPQGNVLVFEYDPEKKAIRTLLDVKKLLNRPKGRCTPGKVHGRLNLGDDGWLYFATQCHMPKAAAERSGYKGDWLIRCQPATGLAEVVAEGPVARHGFPGTLLDPKRLIFYGSTAPGIMKNPGPARLLAYDVRNGKKLYEGPDPPARCMIVSRSTGRMYYVPGPGVIGALVRFDPVKDMAPVKTSAVLGLRAAAPETTDGLVYTTARTGKGKGGGLYAFDTKTEKVQKLGPAAVGACDYVTSLTADAKGRYLYYVPGADNSSPKDGSPVVQFDTKTKKRKVIAFLHSYYEKKYGATLRGTFSVALDARGDRLYITWNVSRGNGPPDCCALMVVHVPEGERAN